MNEKNKELINHLLKQKQDTKTKKILALQLALEQDKKESIVPETQKLQKEYEQRNLDINKEAQRAITDINEQKTQDLAVSKSTYEDSVKDFEEMRKSIITSEINTDYEEVLAVYDNALEKLGYKSEVEDNG